MVAEVTVGRNWAEQLVSNVDAGDARPERSPRRARRPVAVLPERQSAVPGAADQLRRHQRPAEHARRRRRRPLSVQRQEHHLELLREPVEDCRQAQPEDRDLLRAHGASGAARRGVQRQLQLRRQRQQPVRHQPRVLERAARFDQQLHRVDGQAVRRGAVQPGRVVRAGQLAHDVAPDPRLRRALLLHRPDLRRRSGRVVFRHAGVGGEHRRRCCSSPCARTTRQPARATSGSRGIRSPGRSSTTPTSTSSCRTPATSTTA